MSVFPFPRHLFGVLAAVCLPHLAVAQPAARQDPYDAAKMDLKPVPARVSQERHKGRSRRAPRSAWAPSSSRSTRRR